MPVDESNKSNANYLKSAINMIYGDDDDFIVIGLTGRTGSGCSTAATILKSKREDIRHSLFSGKNPQNNEQRKERIILNYFNSSWSPFLLIQVRSIITTFLLDSDFNDKNLQLILDKDSDRKILIGFLKNLSKKYQKFNVEKSRKKYKGYSEFYSEVLPKKCDELRESLGESSFVKLYQVVGNNIRMSGDAFKSTLTDGKFFTLVERINAVIKIIHKERITDGEKTYIVVDALRNSLEALFFQDRYSSFFLLAISAPEADRRERLRKLKYTDDDIILIDKNEYTSREFGDTEFYTVQDIQACLQRADLYISNPSTKDQVSKYQGLANQLIRFIALIRRPGIVTPSAIERCMQVAYTAKLNSGCISRQVGAVVTDQNFSIRSVGWNDAPYGQVPCNLRNRNDLLEGSDFTAYSNFEKTNSKYLEKFKQSSQRFTQVIKDGRSPSFCFKSEYNAFEGQKNQVHTRSLHAEENAFLQIAKYGLCAIEGGILFTTASPCELCAKKACQLGIVKIYFIDPYPGIAMEHILQGGLINPTLILFSGAIGRAFHKLFSPIVAYKDELHAMTL